MINLKVGFFYALLILAHSQYLLPISNCLANCYGCELKNPNTCFNQIRTDTGQQGRCLPYYDSPNCTIGNSYYNIYAENGLLNNFANWSAPNQPPLQQCPILNQPTSVAGIGPFNSTNPAKKTLLFSSWQGVRRLLIKIGVVVSDSLIANSNNNGSQQVQEVEINGQIFITTTNTLTNSSLLNNTIPFLTMRLTDLLNKNNVVTTAATGYQFPSLVVTKCGHVYQYQFTATSTNSSFQQLQLELALPPGTNTLWWLMDFRVEAGCSGFSVGNSCDSCLTSFYPIFTQEGYPNGCRHCNFACATCAQNGYCLTCQLYATLNATTKTCFYSSNYLIYNTSASFTTSVGTLLQSTSYAFSQIYRSQNRILNLGLQLANNQSYLMKFYLLFPESYSQNKTNFIFSIDSTVWNTSNLDYSKATLTDVNNGQLQLFVLPFIIDRMGKTKIGANSSLQVTLSSTQTEEFYLADITIVQYQCSKNCLDCSFNLAQTSTCNACLPFYRTDTNCLTCANGFYQAHNGTLNRCVKCYANCKQCMGPTNYQCIQCFPSFELKDITYNTACINKIFNAYKNNADYIPSIDCINAPSIQEVTTKANCAACLSSGKSVYSEGDCLSCWLGYNYVWGRCEAMQSSGLTFYASDIVLNSTTTLWVGDGLVKQGCTSDYPNIVGIPNLPNNSNHTLSVPTTLTYTLNTMPSHFGFTFFLNLYKIDYWGVDPNNKSPAPLNITIFVDSPGASSSQFILTLNNSIGANICHEESNQMIWTLQANIADHSSSAATIRILSPDKGIFVRQLTIYLGNCIECTTISLSYALTLLPVYADNATQTGLDVYVTFNKPISFTGLQENPMDVLAKSFSFTVGSETITNYVIKENKVADPQYSYIKYFLPLNASYINTTVTATTSQASLIYTKDQLASRQLPTASQTVRLQRYDDASLDTRNSISQLSKFFDFFSWFSLILMIITVGLGVGVVFQQFSLMMQIIFYHIYITSPLLPPTIKVPLSHAHRMEHLNYFADIESIQKNLFKFDPIPSNYIYTQFNIDIYFLRSIYPILIINAIFIGWFVILKILYRVLPSFSQSSGKIFRFLRSIPNRPISFFDQIWRYQFLAVMWACMLQFSNFKGQGGQRLNLVICVLAFVISLVWPFVVTIYTYYIHATTNAKHFLYLYHDIYYLKMSSLADQPKYYLYVGMKTGRLLAYAVFIGLFVNQSIIGPVLLIFINLIDAAVSFFLDIYRTGAYLLTRLIQNTLLIIAGILCLVLFGFSDDPSFQQTNYEDIGFGLSTVFVLIVVNGLVRFFYLVYKKVEQWRIGTYDVGEHGELQNFDNKSPMSPMKLPQESDRL